MIRKFKNWLRNWINEVEESDGSNILKRKRKPGPQIGLVTASNNDSELGTNPIRLFIYPANGGFVVETRDYDEKRDRYNNTLYLITDHEQMGEELSKIITMMSLAR